MGEGTYGVVYRATDMATGHTVAVKVSDPWVRGGRWGTGACEPTLRPAAPGRVLSELAVGGVGSPALQGGGARLRKSCPGREGSEPQRRPHGAPNDSLQRLSSMVRQQEMRPDESEEGVPSSALREIAILLELRHDNVVRYGCTANRT